MGISFKQPVAAAGAVALVLAATGYAASGSVGIRSHGRPSVTPPPKCLDHRAPWCRPGGHDNDGNGHDNHGGNDRYDNHDNRGGGRHVDPPGHRR